MTHVSHGIAKARRARCSRPRHFGGLWPPFRGSGLRPLPYPRRGLTPAPRAASQTLPRLGGASLSCVCSRAASGVASGGGCGGLRAAALVGVADPGGRGRELSNILDSIWFYGLSPAPLPSPPPPLGAPGKRGAQMGGCGPHALRARPPLGGARRSAYRASRPAASSFYQAVKAKTSDFGYQCAHWQPKSALTSPDEMEAKRPGAANDKEDTT